MEEDDYSGVDDGPALDRLAELIDQAADTQDGELTDRALRLSEHLAARGSLSGEQRVLLHYFRANAFENKLHEVGEARTWAWEIPFLEKVILELRRAVRDESFASLDPFRRCQILTNLGSKLNSIGRPVEALALWDAAIALNPRFAMALANRGLGLRSYANSLYDGGHAGLLLADAHDSLIAASADDAVFDSPQNLAHAPLFANMAADIARGIDVEGAREDLHRDFGLGRSRVERTYRGWALQNRLFLNPLNDLGPWSIAAHDVLHLPSLTTAIHDTGPGPPVAFGFYNQLKQEYVSARWLCFEGLHEQRAHFSDRGTHLYDTLSIPAYSLAVEKTKVALRMAYSLLDKVAFFINDYFQVGLPEKAVSFRSVWHERKGDPKPLAAVFRDRKNWPLRGLFWLARDIFEPAFQDVAEPEAQRVAELRNHLEHKYCQVHEDLGIGYSRFAESGGGKLAFTIGRDALEAKTLHILQKARAALIYLSLAVHREQGVRDSGRDGGLVMQMPLWMWRERGRL